MSSFALTAYVLMWPVMATAVLAVLCVALFHDIRRAKRSGNDLI